MRLLLLSQARFLRRAPWSTASALAGVALGVASVVAVHLIGTRVEQSLADSLPPHLSGISHVLSAPEDAAGFDADRYFELRDWWRATRNSGIEALVPLLEGETLAGGKAVRVVGVDWLAYGQSAGQLTGLTDAASDPVGSDVIAGAALLADRSLGLDEGATVRVAGRDHPVAGVLDSGGPALFADIALAQQMLALGPDRLSAVGLRVADPWRRWRAWLDGLMPGLSAGLPRRAAADLATLLARAPQPLPAAIAGWRVRSAESQRPSAVFARSVLFNLGALGTLALLVAWFLIHQVGVIWLRRQRLLLDRLRVIGVAERALHGAFVGLFAALGACATVAGLLLGAWLAELLVALSAAGAGMPPAQAAGLDGWVVLKAALSGIGVCLVGGHFAFARARPAHAALRAQPAGRRASRVSVRWVVAAVLAGMVAAGLGWESSGLIGAFGAILGMSLLTVLATAPLLGVFRVVAAGPGLRWPLRLAWRDVAANPRLLSVAVAALALAVATSIGVGTMVASFRTDFERMLSVRLAGDVYLYDTVARQPALLDWLEARADVTGVTRFGEQPFRLDGVPVSLGYTRFDAVQAARYGQARALAAGEALISERLARDLGVAPGDRLPGVGLSVAGLFPGFGDPEGRLLVDVASLAALGIEPRFDRLMISTRRPDALLEDLAGHFPDLRAQSRDGLRNLALALFDRTFAITQALTGLALIVAVVGTYNALTALRLQQLGTVFLLAAQGADAARIRLMGVYRAATLGSLAVMLALPLGLAMAWTLCTVINPRAFGWTLALELPLAGWLMPLCLGLAAAIGAGLLPAPRERSDVHEAA